MLNFRLKTFWQMSHAKPFCSPAPRFWYFRGLPGPLLATEGVGDTALLREFVDPPFTTVVGNAATGVNPDGEVVSSCCAADSGSTAAGVIGVKSDGIPVGVAVLAIVSGLNPSDGAVPFSWWAREPFRWCSGNAPIATPPPGAGVAIDSVAVAAEEIPAVAAAVRAAEGAAMVGAGRRWMRGCGCEFVGLTVGLASGEDTAVDESLSAPEVAAAVDKAADEVEATATGRALGRTPLLLREGDARIDGIFLSRLTVASSTAAAESCSKGGMMTSN